MADEPIWSCTVCFTKESSPYQLAPCAHTLCERCSKKLLMCPQCHSPIQGKSVHEGLWKAQGKFKPPKLSGAEVRWKEDAEAQLREQELRLQRAQQTLAKAEEALQKAQNDLTQESEMKVSVIVRLRREDQQRVAVGKPALLGLGTAELGAGQEPTPITTSSFAQPQAKALYDYMASTPDELTMKAGEVLTILSQDSTGWWEAELRGNRGWVPANYIEKL